MQIPIAKIVVASGRTIAPAKIARFRELLLAGSVPPPIEVYAKGANGFYLLHEGNHRLTAAKRAGRIMIEAIVLERR